MKHCATSGVQWCVPTNVAALKHHNPFKLWNVNFERSYREEFAKEEWKNPVNEDIHLTTTV
ncbi:hypothetical protein [Chamaesiphon polymorphus]|uniref:hypothetical protein n=1 Tax=Chamaesiphon polymorphus TaxID=2107691 RepID=UPI0015E7A122|nr:hypothetical protein [Chamaesiphon polymorphus]